MFWRRRCPNVGMKLLLGGLSLRRARSREVSISDGTEPAPARCLNHCVGLNWLLLSPNWSDWFVSVEKIPKRSF